MHRKPNRTRHPLLAAVLRDLTWDRTDAQIAEAMRLLGAPVTRQAVNAWRKGHRKPSNANVSTLLRAMDASAEVSAGVWEAMGVRGVA